MSWSARSLVAALILLSAACSSNPRAANKPATTTSAPLSTTTVPATTTSTTIPKGSVTFAFAGDTHFEGPLAAALAANPAGVLAPMAPILARYDIAMVNLETAITERGTPAAKQFTFRAPASALTALTGAGIDVATEANNHGIDYGPAGLVDTLGARALSPGVHVIGIGRNAADAYAPYRATVHGQRVAIIAATQVIDDALITAWTATDTHPGVASAKEVPRLLAAVHAARITSDTVVVFLHWGAEGLHCPTGNQRDITRQLVDAGADVIVGSHSHQLEGAGRLGGALVDYGLGNFAFYTGGTSGVLVVRMTGRHVDSYGWAPAHISGGVPYPTTGDAAQSALAAWQALRTCTDLAP